MNGHGGKNFRRWQPAIAIVAALSLFVSLVAGDALRSQFSAASLPEPAAWLHATPDTEGHAAQQAADGNAAAHVQHASWGASPQHKKPFHSTWMTHGRPDTWPRMQTALLWPALPASFANNTFHPGEGDVGPPQTQHPDQDILALNCIARR
ncbi:hypothetical protein [Mycobacterium sherrisii]|uniref:Uncharacterized protein n=1 Tax=Mycobacterium sherrisii TaxID=243061 RepID=A0A1E3T7Z8_9MYCO|nr:hypothetical protein [Mycobacterium sherrisii]MCV7028741.1 hypothetical protein [Mycobacterium sherrisii]MEC4761849.1 hypothetical protein [Mycobacterium sherrisii]ODR10517.1 hypothetical protein BHQ21_02210 [Mycobacterium sherrisii]ORW82709.1 hypothetical protein AWC25_02085 [Mycobacterium sherrisii]